MKRRLTIVFLCLVFLLGLSLVCYPTISNLWNSYTQSKAVITYMDEVDGMGEETINKIWAEANEYNESLVNKIIRWNMTQEEEAEYEKQLDFALNGIMGYVEIPKINVSAPIYHGTSESVLQKGVGHIKGSSLPVGGKTTHSAISGHTGLPSAKLFTDLHKLELGDKFYIHILEKTLVYEVDLILTVAPDDMSALKIEKDKDYCTIVTCTPYGINSHRLLVRGHRTIEDGSTQEVITEIPKVDYSIFVTLTAAIFVVAIIACLIVIITKRKKR